MSMRLQTLSLAVGICCLTAPLQAQMVSSASAAVSAPIPSAPTSLTPPAPPTPRINGPSVYGERPGNPFLYTIPATGDRPMLFSAEGLPDGLKLNRDNGQITGSVATAGNYTVKLTAENAVGKATRKFTINIGETIALTPPMGWNSWNSWAGTVDMAKVKRAAQLMVEKGLINHGWTYVNIDDTWQGQRTGPDHALQANEKFPDMKSLTDELHQMGLKAGIYSTPWITSYAGYAGGSSDSTEGAWSSDTMRGGEYHRYGANSFADTDAKQFADWGFDYLKYDWYPNEVPYVEAMSKALRASGRDIIYSLSNSARMADADELEKLANSWRTTGDITDTWGRGSQGYNHGIGEIGFLQDNWAHHAGPGHWNDPDMLVVGYVSVGASIHPTRLTPDEQYTHISLWCLLSAPLLIGCDLDRLDDFTLGLLTNDEVLAIDQDSLGQQARQVSGPVFEVPPPPMAAGARGRNPRGAQPPSQPADAPLTQAESNAVNTALRALLTQDADAKAILDKYPNYNLITRDQGGNNRGGNGLVFAKPLEDGSIAVGLFNVGPAPEKVTAAWKDLGLGGRRAVRDLWRQMDLGTYENEFSATVPSHGVVLVRIKPAP